MKVHEIHKVPHRRYNILTGEWVLVSPQRASRPWQGKTENIAEDERPKFDPSCYLCPGNIRASGKVNPFYNQPYSFHNDFAALSEENDGLWLKDGLLLSESESGICKVVCFSSDHSLTLPLMSVKDICAVVTLWQKEYFELGRIDGVNHVLIFENKGETMGCSNPHPHGQIWAQCSIPQEIQKKTSHLKAYWKQHNKSLLEHYLARELVLDERVVIENNHFAVVVPYWAIWPYETMIVPKRKMAHIGELENDEKYAFAEIIKRLTTRYDNLFQTSFPYSAGIHQAPTDGKEHPEWHFHMSFYPPLLRSATVKKFMVGYELFACPQRDITAEQAAMRLKNLSETHYGLEPDFFSNGQN
ncbi:UDP-glucose--hexose-1-phosphate uridylyltransferase [Flagellimonas pacifica]|uniref:Galactose-1-phosphate uridylyltransferase n=1 Tax=Flagellimonas pacifica TaxID=1247520 RepID=A0A285MX35_9FLAO|nr:UDP-glucose--hexose-1-phosphate uridylyltransferase [Allomuricauda parva]SNZ01742.1 UTP-hexose-1-phosphate uridylyltransferase /UDP-glucose-hexose-1-phosphate uridylyltransferase [Allomuricauda parva]